MNLKIVAEAKIAALGFCLITLAFILMALFDLISAREAVGCISIIMTVYFTIGRRKET
jgi:hypothetical protein